LSMAPFRASRTAALSPEARASPSASIKCVVDEVVDVVVVAVFVVPVTVVVVVVLFVVVERVVVLVVVVVNVNVVVVVLFVVVVNVNVTVVTVMVVVVLVLVVTVLLVVVSVVVVVVVLVVVVVVVVVVDEPQQRQLRSSLQSWRPTPSRGMLKKTCCVLGCHQQPAGRSSVDCAMAASSRLKREAAALVHSSRLERDSRHVSDFACPEVATSGQQGAVDDRSPCSTISVTPACSTESLPPAAL